MARYYVEAEQFNPKRKPWPHGVKRWARGIYYLNGSCAIRPDDWIVRRAKGDDLTISPDIFEDIFVSEGETR